MKWLLAICTLAMTLAAPGLAAEKPLNVLFITSDDLGLELSCYGDRVIKTPNLDKLASQGVQFEVAHVAQASCSPSRSAMFTGLYPHANGQIGLASGFSMHKGMRTIPAYMKKAGYRTGIIGKLHVNPENAFPFDERPRVDMRTVRKVAEAAETFLNKDKEGLFFLMVNYSDPHAYRKDRMSRDWSFPNQIDGLPEKPIRTGGAPAWPFQGIDDAVQLERIAGYYNCVQRLDAGVGMLLDVLNRSGRADDTLVIFCGDHGPPFARGKTTCYEAGLRVPFLVRWPGVSKPMKSKAMVSTVDILPTILDAAGTAIPDGLHGKSLRSVISDPSVNWRKYLAAEFHFHGASPFYPRRSIRDDRYHLIHNLRAGQARPSPSIDGDPAFRLSAQARYNDTPVRAAFATFSNPPEFELYDLSTDPHELRNLAGREDVKDVQARLTDALMQWRRETNDPFLDAEHVRKFAEGK